MNLRQVFSVALAFAVTAGALVYALWGVDFRELNHLLKGGNYFALVPYLLGLVVFYGLKALRWTVILAPFGKFSWRDVTPALIIGFASNNVLPGHLGEFVRTWVFSRRSGISFSSVLISIAVERLFDIVAILVFYLAAIAMLENPPPSLSIAAWTVALLLVLVWVGILLVLLRPALLYSIYERLTAWLPASTRNKGRRILEDIVRALGSLRSLSQVAHLLGYTISQWLLLGGLIWLSIWAYGQSISLPISLVVLAVNAVAVTVPSAPGYVGALQAAFVIALEPFGIQKEVAIAASVFFMASHWVPVTLLGATFFVREGMRFSAIQADLAGSGDKGSR